MSAKTKLWYLENINLFEGMSEKQMMDVEKRTTMRTATKDQYIYFPEEPSRSLYFLKEGRIKIGNYSEDGKENINAILKPGEVFGELSLAGEDKRNDFAQVMDENVVICAMGMQDMEQMIQMNSTLGLKITRMIGLRLKKTERKLENLIFKDARTRIIELIKDMAKEEGSKVGDETLLKHNLTHQDFANLTATSRQLVTTVLNELKAKDIIHLERKKILIRDLEKLR